jgi:hypothetical protein
VLVRGHRAALGQHACSAFCGLRGGTCRWLTGLTTARRSQGCRSYHSRGLP